MLAFLCVLVHLQFSATAPNPLQMQYSGRGLDVCCNRLKSHNLPRNFAKTRQGVKLYTKAKIQKP